MSFASIARQYANAMTQWTREFTSCLATGLNLERNAFEIWINSSINACQRCRRRIKIFVRIKIFELKRKNWLGSVDKSRPIEAFRIFRKFLPRRRFDLQIEIDATEMISLNLAKRFSFVRLFIIFRQIK